MFTGLVEALGRVERVVEEGPGRRLTLAWPGLGGAGPLALGESVAVNGCCLTVVAGRRASGSTSRRAPRPCSARTWATGARATAVNLERSLRVGDRLGGHFVQGHVDTTAVLRERRPEGEWEFLAFAIDPAWTPLMVPKGSIAVDGVSLTLVDVAPDGFSVMLIPHTLAVTTLGVAPARRPGQHRGRHAGQARRQAARIREDRLKVRLPYPCADRPPDAVVPPEPVRPARDRAAAPVRAELPDRPEHPRADRRRRRRSGPDDVVLEVGPGAGALTALMAERGAAVVAVEIDPAMAAPDGRGGRRAAQRPGAQRRRPGRASTRSTPRCSTTSAPGWPSRPSGGSSSWRTCPTTSRRRSSRNLLVHPELCPSRDGGRRSSSSWPSGCAPSPATEAYGALSVLVQALADVDDRADPAPDASSGRAPRSTRPSSRSRPTPRSAPRSATSPGSTRSSARSSSTAARTSAASCYSLWRDRWTKPEVDALLESPRPDRPDPRRGDERRGVPRAGPAPSRNAWAGRMSPRRRVMRIPCKPRIRLQHLSQSTEL